VNPLVGRTPLSRRNFLGLGTAFVGLRMLPVQGAQDSLAGRGSTGTLRDPTVIGRSRTPTDARENDLQVQAIEQRLACNCGCTLDVFTCRTTDFSCTYSPALHREVLALRDQGKTAQQILDAFVAKYGEKALMAPKPKGVINLTGYLLPAALITSAGAGLLLFIGRRKAAVAQATASGPAGVPEGPMASAQELERLRRALAEMED
jgi:cytochrome c-type biogenesis protein CcmH/NrfF